MRLVSSVLFLLIVAATGAAVVRGQSLADVARQEQERRKAIKDGAKVYTNKDLKEVPPPPPAAAGQPPDTAPQSASDAKSGDKAKDKPGSGSKEQANEPSKEQAKEKDVVKDQAYWSSRMKALQAALERDQIYADALQSRISALTTDFVNRDDPAQRAVVAVDRDKALAELARIKKTILDDKTAISDLEEEARRAGVPPGWLR